MASIMFFQASVDFTHTMDNFTDYCIIKETLFECEEAYGPFPKTRNIVSRREI